MKKKMTVLGGLLMAVAITGYSVSGTYAKYISSMDMTDEARVAKWSIAMTDKGTTTETADINLFANSYTNAGGKYVQAIDTDRVVAPGTSGFYEFDLNATIETNYTLDFKLLADSDLTEEEKNAGKKGSVNNVLLTETEIKAKLGETLPKSITDALVEVGGQKVYSPLLFRVTTYATDGTATKSTWVTYDKLVETFDKAISGNTYDVNGNLTGLLVNAPTTAANEKIKSAKIEWVWTFDDKLTANNVYKTVTFDGSEIPAGYKTNDTLDTMLGNRIAATGADKEANTVRLNMRVTATQTTEAAGTTVTVTP